MREVQNIRPVRLLAPGGVPGGEVQALSQRLGPSPLERAAFRHGAGFPFPARRSCEPLPPLLLALALPARSELIAPTTAAAHRLRRGTG